MKFGACGHPLRENDVCRVCWLVDPVAFGFDPIDAARRGWLLTWRGREREANAWPNQPRTLERAARVEQRERDRHRSLLDLFAEQVRGLIAEHGDCRPLIIRDRYDPVTGRSSARLLVDIIAARRADEAAIDEVAHNMMAIAERHALPLLAGASRGGKTQRLVDQAHAAARRGERVAIARPGAVGGAHIDWLMIDADLPQRPSEEERVEAALFPPRK